MSERKGTHVIICVMKRKEHDRERVFSEMKQKDTNKRDNGSKRRLEAM